ncbi:MAG: sugar phosphate isomerase/epimerase family protein [Armatimonadota bacterium]
MLKKGISYWSFPGGLEGTKPAAEAIAEAKKLGYDSLEFCLSGTGDVSLETTEGKAKEIVKMAKDSGLELSSLATGLFWGKSLSASDPAMRAEALEIGKKLIDVAAWLEVGAVLVVPGSVDVFFDPGAEVIDYSVVWDRATEAVGKLLPRAEAAKVAIGVENVWNKFLVGPVEIRAFVDQFGSDWVGSYFDVGNCMPVGYPEQWIRLLGKRIKRVHFKDFKRSVGTADGFVDLLEGDVNWPEVLKALAEVGYDGYVTAEMLPPYKYAPNALVATTSVAMDAILGR